MSSIFKTDDAIPRSGEKILLGILHVNDIQDFSFRTLCILFVFLLMLPFPLVSSFIIHLLLKKRHSFALPGSHGTV